MLNKNNFSSGLITINLMNWFYDKLKYFESRKKIEKTLL